jgi:hypothetical protein
MPGVKTKEIDLTKGRGATSQGAPRVKTKEINKSGGGKKVQGAPDVKVTEKDTTKK